MSPSLLASNPCCACSTPCSASRSLDTLMSCTTATVHRRGGVRGAEAAGSSGLLCEQARPGCARTLHRSCCCSQPARRPCKGTRPAAGAALTLHAHSHRLDPGHVREHEEQPGPLAAGRGRHALGRQQRQQLECGRRVLVLLHAEGRAATRVSAQRVAVGGRRGGGGGRCDTSGARAWRWRDTAGRRACRPRWRHTRQGNNTQPTGTRASSQHAAHEAMLSMHSMSPYCA
jgi:hypothetical protein